MIKCQKLSEDIDMDDKAFELIEKIYADLQETKKT